MTLRTRSRSVRTLVWMCAAVLCLAAYVFAVRLFGTGPAGEWYAPEQMRILLPIVVLFGFIAYETRWDGVVRTSDEDEDAGTSPAAEPKSSPMHAVRAAPASAPMSVGRTERPVVREEELSPETENAANEAWLRAREMPHAWIPHPEEDAEYLTLVLQAADGGCVPALLKLSEYAGRRGALVEAYFWMALAEKRGHAAARQHLMAIRKEWVVQQYPPEYENVYYGFTELRGSVGRALLSAACGLDVPLARRWLRDLAEQGQPDACLLTGIRMKRQGGCE